MTDTRFSYTGHREMGERERRAEEEHYGHVAQSAARLKASKAAKNAAFAASTGKPAGVSAPKAAKAGASTSASTAAKPKATGPSADFRAGFNGGLKCERMRIAHVYAAAKANGQEAEALRLLAETELDMVAIASKLDVKASRSLVEAMKARHGLGGGE